MVIDGQHNGRCVSLDMLFRTGRTLYERKGQHDGFATLDGVEVMNNRFGETFHGDTTEAAPSMKDQTEHVKDRVSVAYRSPYGVIGSTRFLVEKSPADM